MFTFKQGRVADRGHDARQFRASGLNLVIAAIVYWNWNSTYITDAVAHLRAKGQLVPDELLAHTSPLTWEHIGFSGDFLWDRAAATAGRSARAAAGWPHDRCSRPVHPSRCPFNNRPSALHYACAYWRRISTAAACAARLELVEGPGFRAARRPALQRRTREQARPPRAPSATWMALLAALALQDAVWACRS